MTSGKGTILLSITGWDPGPWKDALERAAPGRPVVTGGVEPGNADVRYAVAWKPQTGLLESLPNLQAVFSVGAGVDHILSTGSVPDVPIIRAVSQDLTNRMSEYVVWQVLDHHRMGALYRRQQSQRIWHEDRRQPSAHEVTIGIMGLGELGRDAGRKLASLGFKVSGWSRTEKSVEAIACHHGEAGLDAFLKHADMLVVLLPLTETTRGILNLDLFSRLKTDSELGPPVLINAGRGGLQREDDILAALDGHLLSAASLDVFNEEPLPADHPLWRHPRVTITPHAAATSDPQALVPPMIRQMENHEAGKPFENIVDRSAQY